MSRRTYRQPVLPEHDLLADTQLPTHAPIAIYYRQSTDAQIGNVSTTVQTVDMVNYLKHLGWSDEHIIMIDMDGGESGTKKIDERPGMSLLYGHITNGTVGAVACQDEDRLFRDVTQIQVNIFIEACRANRVLVITPSVVYNFAHPQLGTFHARQFRFKSEMAAEYINTIIKGKLHASKLSLHLSGKWSGNAVPAGFMIDMRKKLPDGTENFHYRKIVPFEPYAEVIRVYFELFISYSGNLAKTLRHIRYKGPHFPNPKTCVPPEGFRIVYKIKQHGNGWFPKAKSTLTQMFTNAAYIGHWVANGYIVQWNNHPAIVDDETFSKAFNYLSRVTLTGDTNPDYRPPPLSFRPSRQAERTDEVPILSGLIYSKTNGEWKLVGTHWQNEIKGYSYVLTSNDGLNAPIWRKKAIYFDAAVADLLLGKLKVSFNLDEWQTAIEESFAKLGNQKRLLESQLQHLETVMDNLVTSLETLSNPQMIAAVEQRYQAASDERERLQSELETVTSSTLDTKRLIDLKVSFKETIETWEEMSSDDKREVIHAFLARIEATLVRKEIIDLVLYWKDESIDTLTLRRVAPGGTMWLPQHTALLLKLVESGASKLEIAKAFPDFKWRFIYNRYTYITGNKMPKRAGKTLGRYETYNEYAKRVGLMGRTGNISETNSPISPSSRCNL